MNINNKIVNGETLVNPPSNNPKNDIRITAIHNNSKMLCMFSKNEDRLHFLRDNVMVKGVHHPPDRITGTIFIINPYSLLHFLNFQFLVLVCHILEF